MHFYSAFQKCIIYCSFIFSFKGKKHTKFRF